MHWVAAASRKSSGEPISYLILCQYWWDTHWHVDQNVENVSSTFFMKNVKFAKFCSNGLKLCFFVTNKSKWLKMTQMGFYIMEEDFKERHVSWWGNSKRHFPRSCHSGSPNNSWPDQITSPSATEFLLVIHRIMRILWL